MALINVLPLEETLLEKEEFVRQGTSEPKVLPDDSVIVTVEKQSAVMHLEEKEEFTPGHEPKVLPDDIMTATVEKQSVVMHLEEKEEF